MSPTAPDARRRFAAAAGAGLFVLVVLGALLVVDPGAAMLLGLAAGAGAGTLVYLAGTLRAISREPAVPPAPAEIAAEPADAVAEPGPQDTARLSPEDVLRAADLHSTVRLEPGAVDYLLPEVTPEAVLREREGIDEAFLRAGVGIEESATPSENVSGAPPGPEEHA